MSALKFSDRVKELMEKEEENRKKGFTEEFEVSRPFLSFNIITSSSYYEF